ncbi:MAG: phosphoribosylamine--glycine ligase, partial [Mycoplasmoidaceae bacterium]|nr:phosphoribosylamine--glycine ligase [Mycoplasmoidaceae bacterium]
MAQNKKVTKIYVAPGNAGTALEDKCENVSLHSNEEYLKFAKTNKIDLTVVGPEQLLVDGVVDLFKKNKLKIFGPNKKAAQLEGSKIFAKKFMEKHNIPTAKFGSFTNAKDAIKYLKEKCEFPIVIKADGLAAGKGVEICPNLKSAINCINEFMVKNIFKTAGSKVVIEKFLEGPEASIICITDGNTIYPFVSSKDHKQVYDNDKGPNTGGMGAICPNPFVTKPVLNAFIKQIMLPTLNGLKKDKIDFMGFIFFGIMITKNGPKLLEYNVRNVSNTHL